MLKGETMLTQEKDRAAVQEFCAAVREKLGAVVKEIRLFGSKATGMDTPESDIDLFIVVSERTPQIEDTILDLAFNADLKYDVYISPRVVAQSVLDDPVWKTTAFIKKVEHEGVAL
jgi:uncharacterized protein